MQLVALFVQLGQHFLRFGQLVAQGGGGVVQRLLQRLHTVVQRSLGLLPRSQQRRGVLQGDLRRGERRQIAAQLADAGAAGGVAVDDGLGLRLLGALGVDLRL